MFPCTKNTANNTTSEETIKIVPNEWFIVYGASKKTNSDEDVGVRSTTAWYRGVLRALAVLLCTKIPYTHRSNPLCEQQIQALKENVTTWYKTERTKHPVTPFRVIALMMKSREDSATGYSSQELFFGRLAWFRHAPYPKASYSTIGGWMKDQQNKV